MAFKFSVFCNLLASLEDIVCHDPPYIPADRREKLRRETEGWFRAHRRGIDNLDSAGTVALISSLLPERRTDRVYGIQSTTLARTLSRSLGLSSAKARDLQAFKRFGRGDLGECIERVLRDGGPPALPVVTIEEIDRVLVGLASRCQFSDPSIRSAPSTSDSMQTSALANLFRRLHASEAKWLVRLVLKDFAPVCLDEHLILKNLHFILPDILRFQQNFDVAIDTLKGPFRAYPSCPDIQSASLLRRLVSTSIRPTVGVKIARSNFCKGRSIDQCVKIMGNRRWLVERKYDGEYCEMHLDLTKGDDWLKIFSKSGKDSSDDRKQLKTVLKKALQIGTSQCRVRKQCILLGEMVLYSDHEKQVLPFHKIRKHVTRSGISLGTNKDSQAHEHEHLMIIFFDLLLLDDNIVINRPVEERKALLNSIYKKRQGRAITAESKLLDFADADSRRKLMSHFASSVAARHEGLVLKPCGQPYFTIGSSASDGGLPLIKLKKDYISGLANEADLAVVGASCNAQKALKANAGPRTYTQYHVACLLNPEDVTRFQARPQFKTVGTIGADQCIPATVLSRANELVKASGLPFAGSTTGLNFDLENACNARIDVVISNPFVFEVIGSSFDKNSNTDFWMLRHPRVRKLHEDRTWRDCVSFSDLQKMAREAVSAPVDSESQENILWMEKIERSCKRKIARASAQTTPATTTSLISPVSTRNGLKLLFVSPNARSKACSTTVAESPLKARSGNIQLPLMLPTPPVSSPNAPIIGSPGASVQKRQREAATEHSSKRLCHSHIQACTELGSREPENRSPLDTRLSAAKSPKSAVVTSLSSDTNQRPVATNYAGHAKPTSVAACTSSPSHTLECKVQPLTGRTSPEATVTVRAGVQNSTTFVPRRPSNQSRPDTCRRQGGSCSLSNSVLYIPLQIARSELIDQARLHGAMVITNLKHWDRNSLAYTPLGSTVSESQAFVGLRKMVIVDSKSLQKGLRNVVREVRRLNKRCFRERVEFHDLSCLDDCRNDARGSLLGILDWDFAEEKSVWIATGEQ